jgi:hypothetical protein
MVRIRRSLALVGGFCTLLSASVALAQGAQSASGFGQSWPNTTDVSASPHYHVYLFSKDGIRYFQINNLNGDVLAAVAVANAVVITLPIGSDAGLVTHSATPQMSGASETVYSDKGLTLTATPKENGQIAINTAVNTATAENCDSTGYDCTGSNIQSQVGTP